MSSTLAKAKILPPRNVSPFIRVWIKVFCRQNETVYTVLHADTVASVVSVCSIASGWRLVVGRLYGTVCQIGLLQPRVLTHLKQGLIHSGITWKGRTPWLVFPVTGTFVPTYFRSRERKFHGWNFRSLELSFHGTERLPNCTTVHSLPNSGIECDFTKGFYFLGSLSAKNRG